MMIFATAYYGFREQSPVNYFEMAAALGIHHVEIPLYAHIIKDPLYNLRSVEAIDRLHQMAADSGVEIVASVSNLPVAPGVNLWGGTLDESTVKFGLAAAHRVIDIAAQLGIRVARITEPNIAPGRSDEAEYLLEQCGYALRPLADHAAERDLRIVVENYGVTARQIQIVLEAANHPALGLLYDPCNFHRIGEDPLAALHTLRDSIAYVHLKDAFRDDQRDPNSLFEGSRWAPSVAVGEGEIDWPPLLSALRTSYDGYISIEYEMPQDVMRGTRTSLAYVRALLTEEAAHG